MMTLEEYSVLVTKRFKRALITMGLFLVFVIPLCFYGGDTQRTIAQISVALANVIGCIAGGWVEWSEIRKYVKKNHDGNRGASAA